jgi:hypothetical protein
LAAEGSLLNQWFERGTLTSMLQEHRAGRVDHGKRIYALTMLALWLKGSL